MITVTILLIEGLKENTKEIDSLHHGLIFPAAIAVREGLFPNLDAFAQYGPLNPFLQGSWLKIAGNRVFDLQTFTLLITILIGILLFFGCRPYVGDLTGSLIALAWFATGPQGLPWASLPANLLILTQTTLIIANSRSTFRREYSLLIDFIAGLLIAIGTFARIQTVLVAGSVFIILMTISRRRALNYFSGNFFGFVSIIGFLQLNGAFIPFIKECIIWSSKTLGLAEVQPISVSYIFELSWFIWTPTFLILAITLLHQLDKRPSSTHKTKYFTIFIFTCLSISIGVISNVSFTPVQLKWHRVLLNPEYLLLTASRKFLFTLDFAPLLTFLSLAMYLLISRRVSGQKLKTETKLALAAGIPCTSQIFPIADSYHMWFLAPILILCIIVLKQEFKKHAWEKQINIILIFLLIGLQVQTIIDLKKPRYSFQNYTLSGMKSSLPTAPDLDKTMTALEKYITPHSTRFICPDGIYSVSGGTYNSVDSNFVSWSSRSGTFSKNSKYTFICHASVATINNYENYGWRVLSKTVFSTEPTSFNVLMIKIDRN